MIRQRMSVDVVDDNSCRCRFQHLPNRRYAFLSRQMMQEESRGTNVEGLRRKSELERIGDNKIDSRTDVLRLPGHHLPREVNGARIYIGSRDTNVHPFRETPAHHPERVVGNSRPDIQDS